MVRICMRKILLIVMLLSVVGAHADVIGEYSFKGTLGDRTPVEIRFCVNGDEIAVGEIYYPKAKNPKPILIVGSKNESGSYNMDEYQEDGTITGSIFIEIGGEGTVGGVYVEKGTWTNPRTGKSLPMKNMRATGETLEVTKYLDYEDPQNIGREYQYSIWNPSYQSMMGGTVRFRAAGKYKLHFEVENARHNIAEGKSEPNRPAVLGETTHDYFYYENVNECGYGFSAHFFKKFVVLKTTTGYGTLSCFGMGASFDGVYIKVKQ